MMKLAVLTSLVGSAAAFAPALQPARSSTSLSVTNAQQDFFDITATGQDSATALSSEAAPAEAVATEAPLDFSTEIGALVPLGFFDPLGFLDDATQEEFENLRWAELKHGRVCMLAFVGYLLTYEGLRFPGAEDIPAGFAALDNLPGMVWAQFLATVALMEVANQDMFKAPWGENMNNFGPSPAEFKGDFRNNFLDFGWDSFDDATKLKKRTIELNNGRAAMCGITAIMVHEKLGNLDLILPGGSN